jgi:hypothetical protein
MEDEEIASQPPSRARETFALIYLLLAILMFTLRLHYLAFTYLGALFLSPAVSYHIYRTARVGFVPVNRRIATSILTVLGFTSLGIGSYLAYAAWQLN